MFILVPGKPVALALSLMSVLVLVGYSGSASIWGNDPFAVSTRNWHPSATHPVAHSALAHTHNPHRPS